MMSAAQDASNTSSVTSNFIDLTHNLSPTTTLIYPGDPSFVLSPISTHKEHGASIKKVEMGTHTGTHIDAPFHFVEDGKTVDQLELTKDLLSKEIWMIDFTVPPRGKEGLNLQERQKIEWDDIKPHLPKDLKNLNSRVVLFYTGWSKSFYHLASPHAAEKYFSHPFLSAKVAQHLLDLGVRVIGLDIPSPDETPAFTGDAAIQQASVCPCPTPGHADASVKASTAETYPFHIAFLSAGAGIVENMANLDLLAAAIRNSEYDVTDECDTNSDPGEERRKRWLVSVAPLRLEGADGSPVRAFASLC
ncbi:hypothetical protein CPB83DRAFT_862972 [Crepidotus variabilis]|uniref:Cyclase n=1 Tax=Crepidotus variabilis TaxID=179855 RepID=A0A9P6JJV4_9AGAR|nr:hypothetical protein CPB83DRAFT_862972 [Crepidotus variabilis]